jgi:hypothetical protein
MKSNDINLDHNLFTVAISVARCNWKPSVAAALLLLGASAGQHYVSEPLPFTVLRALILMIVGYSAYRALLSGGAVAGWRSIATADGRIPWRYAGVMLMILSPVLFLGIVWTAPGTGVGPAGLGEVALGLVLVVAYTVAYVLLGTALPEVAERGDASLSTAIARGRAYYRRIATAMVLGPWIFRACVLVVLIGASLAGFTVDLFDARTGAFQPEALLPVLFLTGGHVFAEILTAVVLVRAYRSYPATGAGALPA